MSLRVERIVDGMVERYHHAVDVMVQAHLENGRPPWHHALTPAEKLARFEDQDLRRANLQKMLETLDPENPEDFKVLQGYYEKMTALLAAKAKE